jgi:hypothetical protein
MSIRLNAATELVYRTSDIPAATPVTWCFWIYIVTDANVGAALGQILSATYTVYQGAGLASNGTTLTCYTEGGSVSGTNLSTGTWYHVAYTRNGASNITYLNAVSNATRTDNHALTGAFLMFGGNGAAAMNGRLAHIKVWGAALTADELAIERLYAKAQRTADLIEEHLTWSGTDARLADTSGNALTLTAVGTLDDEADPTVPTTTGDAGTFSESATVTSDAIIDSATFSESTTIDSTALADDGFFDDLATVIILTMAIQSAISAKCLRVCR